MSSFRLVPVQVLKKQKVVSQANNVPSAPQQPNSDSNDIHEASCDGNNLNLESSNEICTESSSIENFSIDHNAAEPPPLRLSGSSANISWRSVPWKHLRMHPLYRSLPPARRVFVQSARDLSSFRQDSWQWDALHQGRLTTSKIAAVLGFYEKLASSRSFLDIPQSLCGHDRAVAAWQILKEKQPKDWSHLNADYSDVDEDDQNEINSVWCEEMTDNEVHSFKFPHTYCPHPEQSYPNHRKVDSPIEARLLWGSKQEATGLLAVVNWIHSLEKQNMAKETIGEPTKSTHTYLQLRETGMQVIEALFSAENASIEGDSNTRGVIYLDMYRKIFLENKLPLIGASPDGILDSITSTVRMEMNDNFDPSDDRNVMESEVVEVKCYSPFVTNNSFGRGSLRISRYRPVNSSPIPVWHIPQLQLEMLCTGPQCNSALLVTLYIDGALIYRIKRDDEVSIVYEENHI
jgi:hypothetical protein